MSGLSWNISLPCEAAFGRRYLATVKPGVFPDLVGFEDVSTLTASSRKSYAEGVIARAVAQAGATGLHHFTKGFDTADGHPKWLGNGPWATLIESDALQRVVAHTQSLFAAWRHEPLRLVVASGRDYAIDDVLHALDCPASTVEEAIAAYDERRSRDDGDDLPCIVALLQAHAALAWQARNDGQALFHFTWL